MLLKNAGLAVPVGIQDFRVPAVLATAQTFLTLALAAVVSYSGGSVVVVVWSTVAALWVVAVASTVLGYRTFAAAGGRPRFSRMQVGIIGRFLLFTSATALGHVLFASLDRVVVAAVVGVSAVAYYSVAIAIAVNLLSAADLVTRPLMPAMSAWASERDWSRIRRTLLRSTILIAALEFAAALVLVAASRPFLDVWLGSQFAEHALTPFRVLVVTFAVAAVGAPGFHAANGCGHAWAPAIGGTVGGAATIVLIIALAPLWNVTGAALANLAGWSALLPLCYMMWKLRAQQSPRDVFEAATVKPDPGQ
jgi:O-antigen/teichoic acid export membrane protein